METDCLSKKVASYLAFCAFALTFMIGLGVGVSPLALVGRALTGAAIFWICGLALGSVVVNGLVETMGDGGDPQQESSNRDPASTGAGQAAEGEVPNAQQQEPAAVGPQS